MQINEGVNSRTMSSPLTETVITGTDDGHGNIVETESTVTQTHLYITVSHKTSDEMAEQYGFNSHVEWCACFVSWCANECVYIDAGVIPKYADCVNGVNWFKECG